jgi:DNA-binding winged helix-turn-helix (wHTH) protein
LRNPLIRTVRGRGYQFTGEIRILPASPDERASAGVAAAQSASALPQRPNRTTLSAGHGL